VFIHFKLHTEVKGRFFSINRKASLNKRRTQTVRFLDSKKKAGRDRVVSSTTSVQCKPPYVWTDTVQARCSTVWYRQLALPYGTGGGQFALQFDLSTAVQGLPKLHVYIAYILYQKLERSSF
jgi:hypothetical protein